MHFGETSRDKETLRLGLGLEALIIQGYCLQVSYFRAQQ